MSAIDAVREIAIQAELAILMKPVDDLVAARLPTADWHISPYRELLIPLDALTAELCAIRRRKITELADQRADARRAELYGDES